MGGASDIKIIGNKNSIEFQNSDTQRPQHFSSNAPFLRKLLKGVLHPNEVVNLERGSDIIQTENQHRREVKGSPARQLCSWPGEQPA